MVAVAESDFRAIMETIPDGWRNHLVLIQNELLPRDWETYDVQNPTIKSVWFEKKKGMDYNPILPSPVYGPMADFREIHITNAKDVQPTDAYYVRLI